MPETFWMAVKRYQQELLAQVQPGTGAQMLSAHIYAREEEEEMAAGAAARAIALATQRPILLHFLDEEPLGKETVSPTGCLQEAETMEQTGIMPNSTIPGGDGFEPATPLMALCPDQVIWSLLERFDCLIEPLTSQIVCVTYPAGSQRQELYTRTNEWRWRVLLPAGIELRGVMRCEEHRSLPQIGVIVDARSQQGLHAALARIPECGQEQA